MSRFKPASGSAALIEKPAPAHRPVTSIYVPGFVEAEPLPVNDPQPTLEPSRYKLALIFTLLFVLLRFSFVHEFITSKVGVDTHLLMFIGGLAAITALLTGNLFSSLSHRICIAWTGFAACMCLATATSVWRGGSFAILFPYLRTTFLLVLILPAVAVSIKDLSKVLKVIGLSALIPIALGISSSDYRTGRLELAGSGASIQNSNDFAALLILVLPAIAYFSLRKDTNIVLKIVGLSALGLACFLILGTGSRGALISMAVTTLYILKAGSGKVRVAILFGIPILAIIVIPLLPGEASQRLATLFDSHVQSADAQESSEQRTALLMASLNVTARHPLTGVGPGTFIIYQAQMAEEKGQRGMWHETHNSYTQVSSECGVPAFLFYVCGIGMSLRVFQRGMKSKDKEISGVSKIFALMTVSFAVCMFFLSQAYGFGFPVLGGVAVSLDRILKQREMSAVNSIA